MNNTISTACRKQLLRFLLIQTAAVRSGVKPGELLRVRHCYEAHHHDGLKFCLYRKDIFNILNLDYIELIEEGNFSLVLFFHRTTMIQTLSRPENLTILRQFGYPINGTYNDMLAYLKYRFTCMPIPHEVGLFIGYPAKDVVGFINNLPRTPIHRSAWAVFGDATESLQKMELYRSVAKVAEKLLDTCEDLQKFFEHVTSINPSHI